MNFSECVPSVPADQGRSNTKELSAHPPNSCIYTSLFLGLLRQAGKAETAPSLVWFGEEGEAEAEAEADGS